MLVAVDHNESEGYLKNKNSAIANQGSWDRDTLLWASDMDLGNANLYLRYFSFNYDDTPVGQNSILDYPTQGQYTTTGFNPAFNYAVQNPSKGNVYKINTNYEGFLRVDPAEFLLARYSYDFEKTTLRLILADSRYNFTYNTDFDGTSRTEPQFDYRVWIQENKEYKSYELQLLSNDRKKVDWIGGLFRYSEKVYQPYGIYSPSNTGLMNPVAIDSTTVTNPCPDGYCGYSYYQSGELESNSTAAFGNFNIHLRETVELSIGLRHTQDRREGAERQLIVVDNQHPSVSALVTLLGGRGYLFQDVIRTGLKKRWSATTYDIKLDWRKSENRFYYFSLARGYKTGGFRLGGNQPDPVVSPEHIFAKEFGAKLNSEGGRIQANLSVYQYSYEKMQVQRNRLLPSGTTTPELINTDRARIKGADLEVTAVPVDPVTLSIIYSYNHTAYTKFDGAVDAALPAGDSLFNVAQNLKGNKLNQAPENKLSLVYSHDWYGLFNPGDHLTFTALYAWYDEQYSSIFNTETGKVDEYDRVDLRLNWFPRNDGKRVTLFVKNALDDDNIDLVNETLGQTFDQAAYVANSDSPAPTVSRTNVAASYNWPRTVGLEFVWTFGAGQ